MASIRGMVERFQSMTTRVITPLSSLVLDFVYPPVCLVCGSEADLLSPVFCDSCFSDLKPKLPHECPRCGASVGPYTDLTDGCGQCRGERFAFDRVVRLGIYEGAMRQACLRAKASDGNTMSQGLAELLVHEKRELLQQLKIDLILPIPEHWSRRFLHSHYAAESLSRTMSRKLGVGWSRRILIKKRRTPKQATSSIAARRQQQAGSFGVRRRSQIAGKTVLLVDDILTTGSTANAASRELKLAGASRVVVAVIAVSPLLKT